ncbi:MAG: Wzz/FepE/Etk N-terminal domain-containing protein [Patescibacteria group bacterium]|nr:Wzz/FepE/Etk N-terminal domain-containing protein [Patescibacteria group bacterium]MDD5043923.1 Wzz/FepE/Etk N-terminal domain-containing protein [Patescibacteria group bacterium]MDD5490756.1 Wzz/FepE/Etk N-terminal domain-containing protein [Patescibacteria group bacterium]
MVNYFKVLKEEKGTIITFVLAAVVLSLLLSLAIPWKYSSTIRLLVVQNQPNLDAYTALKSAERVGDNLSQLLYTSTFYDKVLNTKFSIDKQYFKQDEIKKRKQWQKMLYARVMSGTGIMEVVVYHEDKTQATQVANAIAYVLTTEGKDYAGGFSTIKLVDSPLESRYPVKPNFIANVISGFILGFVLGGAYVLLIKSRKHWYEKIG